MTVAKHAGFVTRADAGLMQPRSISRNISPQEGGCAPHYGGERVVIRSHADCVATWRNWQRFHMVTRGWVDIAYTMGVCQHGFVFAGRGAGVRTAANGTNDGNRRFYAVCWIGGANMTPTLAAQQAMAWAIRALRQSGSAGNEIKPHSYFKATGCPGGPWRSWSRKMDGKAISTSGSAPAPSTPTQSDFERWFYALDAKKQEVLEAVAEWILEDGAKGNPGAGPSRLAQSFVRQTYVFLREDRKWIEEMNRLVGLTRPGGLAETHMRGLFVGGINVIDAVRDLGYVISSEERTGATRG